jgi:hypothetical protein
MLMANVDFIMVRGPRSLGELTHALDGTSPVDSDERATVDLGGDDFADIRFDAERQQLLKTDPVPTSEV